MANYSTHVCVNYSPMEMYDLVNDVQSYPAYVPMCSAVRLHAKAADRLRATITLAKGKIKMAFTTENTMQAGEEIQMRLVEGPFKQFRGLWKFAPAGGDGCRVSFEMDFEFANGLLNMAFGGFFREVAASLVEAFCRQAAKKYGPRPAFGSAAG